MLKKIKDWILRNLHSLGYGGLALLVVLGLMNVVHNLTYLRPHDGAEWDMVGNQLQVVSTDQDADTVFQVGDVLLGIDDQTIDDPDFLEEFLHSVAVGSKHLYLLDRAGIQLEPWVVIKGTREATSRQFYVFAFTGFVYLVFLFLLLSQEVAASEKPYLIGFSFLVYLNFAFHHTDSFTPLDWASFYLDQIGGLLLPSALAALAIQKVVSGPRGRPFLQAIHGVPSLVLMLMMLYWVPRISVESLVAGQEVFDILQAVQGYWGGGLIVGSVLLLAVKAELRVIDRNVPFFWGVAWVPFALLMWRLEYPYDNVIAALAPVILPVSILFDWSRRGDLFLGEIAKKVFLHVSVILVLILGYVLFIKLFKVLLGEQVRGETLTLISGLGIMFAALSYTPLQHMADEYFNQLLYGERFKSIKTLLDFSAINRADLDLDEFLSIILHRVQRAFDTDRGIAFKAAEESKRLRSIRGLKPAMTIALDEFPAALMEGEIVRGYQVKAHVVDGERHAPFQAGDFICPLRVSNRLAALIAFSKSEDTRLTPEEMRLLKNLLNQCDVLMENMELYRAVHEKATSIMQLKEYNENIIESSRIGILTTDNMARAVSCNSALSDLASQPRDAILGSTFEQLFRSKAEHNRRQVKSGFTIEGTYLDGHGHELLLEIQKTPLKTKENEVYGALFLVEDIREKRELHQVMMQQEKLASIGLLAAGVAHEINTPLTGIASYSQLLVDDEAMSEDQRELLHLIRGQSQRATHIVSELLNFSRKESAPRGPVIVVQVLRQTLRFLSHQIQRSQVGVTVKEPKHDPMIKGYANQLQQVFVNLIVNAMDAMEKGGELTIEVSEQRRKVCIIFSDTGQGMDDHTSRHIFDPFFTTKEIGKGTGLGLAVVYNIVQDHDGTIEVESAEGEGSTFVVEFPVLREDGFPAGPEPNLLSQANSSKQM